MCSNIPVPVIGMPKCHQGLQSHQLPRTAQLLYYFKRRRTTYETCMPTFAFEEELSCLVKAIRLEIWPKVESGRCQLIAERHTLA
jgi:hypothetical protein